MLLIFSAVDIELTTLLHHRSLLAARPLQHSHTIWPPPQRCLVLPRPVAQATPCHTCRRTAMTESWSLLTARLTRDSATASRRALYTPWSRVLSTRNPPREITTSFRNDAGSCLLARRRLHPAFQSKQDGCCSQPCPLQLRHSRQASLHGRHSARRPKRQDARGDLSSFAQAEHITDR